MSTSTLGVVYFALSSRGGIADYQSFQIVELQRRETNLLVMCTRSFRQEHAGTLGDTETIELLDPAHRLRGGPLLSGLSLLAVYSLNHWKLAWMLLRRRPSAAIISSFSEYGASFWAIPIRVAKLFGRTRISVIVHDTERDSGPVPEVVHAMWLRAAISAVDVVISHDPLGPEYRSKKKHVTTPFPAYDFGELEVSRDAACAKLGLESENTIVLSFGNLRNGKRLDLAIESLATSDNTSLIIAGSPQSSTDRDLEWYKQHAAEVGVSEKCHFVSGYLDRAEVRLLLSAADAMVALYSDDFTSGSAALALAAHYHKPLIAHFGSGPALHAHEEFRLGPFVKELNVEQVAEAYGEATASWRGDFDGYCAQTSWSANVRTILHEMRPS